MNRQYWLVVGLLGLAAWVWLTPRDRIYTAQVGEIYQTERTSGVVLSVYYGDRQSADITLPDSVYLQHVWVPNDTLQIRVDRNGNARLL